MVENVINIIKKLMEKGIEMTSEFSFQSFGYTDPSESEEVEKEIEENTNPFSTKSEVEVEEKKVERKASYGEDEFEIIESFE